MCKSRAAEHESSMVTALLSRQPAGVLLSAAVRCERFISGRTAFCLQHDRWSLLPVIRVCTSTPRSVIEMHHVFIILSVIDISS